MIEEITIIIVVLIIATIVIKDLFSDDEPYDPAQDKFMKKLMRFEDKEDEK